VLVHDGNIVVVHGYTDGNHDAELGIRVCHQSIECNIMELLS